MVHYAVHMARMSREKEKENKKKERADKKRRKLQSKEGVSNLTDDVINDATYFDNDIEEFIPIQIEKIGFDGKGLKTKCKINNRYK
jgi:hypothetical protein